MEILWAETRSKSWGYAPVSVWLTFEAPVMTAQIARVVMEALQDTGILMDWEKHVTRLTVERKDPPTPLCKVIVTIERSKG